MRFIGLVLLSLVAATPAAASAYRDFVGVWDARDATYRAEREALDARAKSSATRAVEALVMSAPEAPEDLVVALAAAWSLSELVGRGQTLWALREHMASRPSAALSEAWMQGKVDELRRRLAEADMIERQIDILKGRDTVSVQHWIAALEQLSMMRGNISGAAAELTLIDQNLRSYYRAQSREPSGLAVTLWAGVLDALRSATRRSQDDFQDRSAACARTGNCAPQ